MEGSKKVVGVKEDTDLRPLIIDEDDKININKSGLSNDTNIHVL